MSRNIILVLMYNRHKLLDLIYMLPFLVQSADIGIAAKSQRLTSHM
jgi:hypothetical protein